jgi:flagellar protein FliJ
MKKSQRLRAVVEIKESHEQKMLEMLGACQREHLAKQTKLENLVQYRQEYLEQYKQQAGKALRVKQMLEYRAFIDKLEKAIVKEEHTLELSARELLEKRGQWELAHQQSISMQKVHDTALDEELQEIEKKEQKELDDRASRGGRNQSAFRIKD